jgi:hypothetical protein
VIGSGGFQGGAYTGFIGSSRARSPSPHRARQIPQSWGCHGVPASSGNMFHKAEDEARRVQRMQWEPGSEVIGDCTSRSMRGRAGSRAASLSRAASVARYASCD